jgi:hypothetical protein
VSSLRSFLRKQPNQPGAQLRRDDCNFRNLTPYRLPLLTGCLSNRSICGAIWATRPFDLTPSVRAQTAPGGTSRPSGALPD